MFVNYTLYQTNAVYEFEGYDLVFAKDKAYYEKSPFCFNRDYKCVWEGEIEVPDDSNDLSICERLFSELNRDDRPNGKVCRSLSTSDVLEINGKYYYCDSVGFKEMTEENLNQVGYYPMDKFHLTRAIAYSENGEQYRTEDKKEVFIYGTERDLYKLSKCFNKTPKELKEWAKANDIIIGSESQFKIFNEEDKIVKPNPNYATEEEQIEEGVRRMEILGILPNVIEEFQKGTINYSERLTKYQSAILYWAKDSTNKDVEGKDIQTIIDDFEGRTDCKVYHAQLTHFNEDVGNMLTLLFVGKEKQYWDRAREDLKTDGYQQAYVRNMTYPENSEFGYITIRGNMGGVIRTDCLSKEEKQNVENAWQYRLADEMKLRKLNSVKRSRDDDEGR